MSRDDQKAATFVDSAVARNRVLYSTHTLIDSVMQLAHAKWFAQDLIYPVLPSALDNDIRYLASDQDTPRCRWAKTTNFLVGPQAVDFRQLMVEDDQVRHKRSKHGLRCFNVWRDLDLRCTPVKENLDILGQMRFEFDDQNSCREHHVRSSLGYRG
jgi:hypothetical protein